VTLDTSINNIENDKNNPTLEPMQKRLWIFPLCILVVAIFAGLFADQVFSYISATFMKLKNFFWAIAFGWSTFLALYVFQLHNRFHAENPDDVPKGYRGLRRSQGIHQFVFHFLGGMVGWVIIYLFIYTNYFTSFSGWEKIILIFIAFLATMGYLPYTLIIKSWLPGK